MRYIPSKFEVDALALFEILRSVSPQRRNVQADTGAPAFAESQLQNFLAHGLQGIKH